MDEQWRDLTDARLRELQEQIASLQSLVSVIARDVRTIADGPFGVAYPDGSVFVQTIQKLKYFIDGSDQIMTPQIIAYRQWEPELSSYFLSALKPGDTFVDVGANFGYFAVLAAHAVGTAGRVIAVEPNPALCRLARKNAVINWSIAPIELLENAAYSENCVLRLYVPRGLVANGSLAQRGDCDAYVVEAKRLDDMISPGTVIDTMKLDVEGYELDVLKGATRVLKESPNVRLILEWSLVQMQGLHDPRDVLAYCESLGLFPHRVPFLEPSNPEEWRALRMDTDTLLAIEYENILMRHDDY